MRRSLLAPKGLNRGHVRLAASEVLKLFDQYGGQYAGRHESSIDLLLFGFLEGRFGYMARQHWVYMSGSERPSRIDFRRGTANPVVIELAVRPKSGGPQLYGASNRSELQKLCRVTNSAAKLRVLLLIDLFKNPIKKKNLQLSFDGVSSGPGRFTRHPVRVIYVHARDRYDFVWGN